MTTTVHFINIKAELKQVTVRSIDKDSTIRCLLGLGCVITKVETNN